VNINITKMAFSIATKLSQSEDRPLAAIEKDILLEEIRSLYKAILESPESDKVARETVVQKIVESYQPQQYTEPEPNYKAVEGVSVVHANVEAVVEKVFEPQVLVEDEVTLPNSEISVTEEKENSVVDEKREPDTLQQLNHEVLLSEDQTTPPQNTFTASVGIGGESVVSSGSINEVFKREENTINSQASNVVRELHSVVASSSFSGMLDLNKRILFTKELFANNSEAFTAFVQQLEKSKGLEEAKSLVNTTALAKQWKLENDAVRQLVSLVRQHFEFR
jgi:hypothetical protein